jgi:four helix bundle protein
MQDFRRLHVWARAHAHTLAIRRAAATFRRDGTAGLRRQMVDAADSVATNIVEGCGADSPREFARFLGIAIKSTSELEYQLQLAHDAGYLAKATWQALSAETIEVRRMLYGLRGKVLLGDSSGGRRNEDADSRNSGGPARTEF